MMLHMLVLSDVVRAMGQILLLDCQLTGEQYLLCSMLAWLKGIEQTLLHPSGLKMCLQSLCFSLDLLLLC